MNPKHPLVDKISLWQCMEKVMGPLPSKEKRCPLDVAIVKEEDGGDFIRRSVTYQSEPGSRVPAFLLIPKSVLDRKQRAPGMLTLHQTNPDGPKIVVGLGKNREDDYGLELVRRGFVCLAPPYPLLGEYQPDLIKLGYVSGTMKAIWDNMRGLDLLESLPFVAPGKFGSIGHSLGGHNGIYTATFDDRIQAVVSSCGFDSYRHYMDGNLRGWSSNRYMPRLGEYQATETPFDFHELIAGLAPRACFVSAPMHDTNFKWWSVNEIAAYAMRSYQRLGARNRLIVVHPNCGHSFPKEIREEAYNVLEKALR